MGHEYSGLLWGKMDFCYKFVSDSTAYVSGAFYDVHLSVMYASFSVFCTCVFENDPEFCYQTVWLQNLLESQEVWMENVFWAKYMMCFCVFCIYVCSVVFMLYLLFGCIECGHLCIFLFLFFVHFHFCILHFYINWIILEYFFSLPFYSPISSISQFLYLRFSFFSSFFNGLTVIHYWMV